MTCASWRRDAASRPPRGPAWPSEVASDAVIRRGLLSRLVTRDVGQLAQSSSGTSGRLSAVSAASALSEVSWLSIACLRRSSRSCSWRICRRRQANSWRARSSMVAACCWARPTICSASSVASSFTRSASARESGRSRAARSVSSVRCSLAARCCSVAEASRSPAFLLGLLLGLPQLGQRPAPLLGGLLADPAGVPLGGGPDGLGLDRRASRPASGRSPRPRSSRPRPHPGGGEQLLGLGPGGSETAWASRSAWRRRALQLVQLRLPHLGELGVDRSRRRPARPGSPRAAGRRRGLRGHVAGLLLGHPQDLLGPAAQAGEVGWSRHRHRLFRAARSSVFSVFRTLAPPLELIEVGLDLPCGPVDGLALVAAADGRERSELDEVSAGRDEVTAISRNGADVIPPFPTGYRRAAPPGRRSRPARRCRH